MTATKQQIIRIRAIMSRLPHFGEAEKETAVMDITAGRTAHISRMSETEAMQLASQLQSIIRKSNGQQAWQPPSADPRIKMQRKIIAMAYEIGWHSPASPCPSEGGVKRKIDMQKLNNWCVKKSYLRKKFNAYTYAELPQLVAQFEKVHHFYLEKLN